LTYWVLLEEEAEQDIELLSEEYGRTSRQLKSRFTQALAGGFATLETFPLAFRVIVEIENLKVRRMLIRGFPKALLYTVNEETTEVRILRLYDTRSNDIRLQ
jgi:ParE toxin of type II toxin-antitoxin system, parDE